jgi:hypothetical protein
MRVMGVLAPGYAIGNTVHSLAVFATLAIDRMADLAVVFLQELLALPNQISRLILGPDGSQRPQKRTAEKQCLPFHVNRRLPYDLYHFSNIIGIISLRLAERDGRGKAWQESEPNLGSAQQC